jgi:glycosyltransferase involved in cell wall biosynthesis
VTVVRNGPHLGCDFPSVDPDPDVRASGDVVVGYLGIMNEQDNLDVFLEMARIVRLDRGRDDVAFVMVGSGDAFRALKQRRDAVGLTSAVRMTGRIPWQQVLRTFAAVDICVQPDLPTLFNEKLTMNKLMEYMAFGKPVVAFDMEETRTSGGDACLYVTRFDAAGLADAVVELADDPARRRELGAIGRQRIEEQLSWEHQSQHLADVYRSLCGSAPGAAAA